MTLAEEPAMFFAVTMISSPTAKLVLVSSAKAGGVRAIANRHADARCETLKFMCKS
jgi:hypothetical protein